MATRSRINVKVGDIYHSVYCHYDGYPEHHLPILQEHYNTQELAELLISGGSISVLAESCLAPPTHSFDTPHEGHTIYYARDRGENLVVDKTGMPTESEEYAYIFSNGEWKVR